MSMHATSTTTTVVQPPMQHVQHPRDRYKSTLYKLGITEVIFGVVFIISSIISIAVVATPYDYRYYDGVALFVTSGIWLGVFAVVSGALGICSQQHPTRCMYVANMVMSIFTTLAMVSMIGVSSVGLALYEKVVLVLILQIACVVGGFIIFVVAIVHSAYCCAGICCGATPHQRGLVYAQTFPGQQLIQLPNGQFVPVQTYPLAVGQGFSASVVNASPFPVQPQSGYMAPSSFTHPYPPQNQFKVGQSAPGNPPPYVSPNNSHDDYFANVN